MRSPKVPVPPDEELLRARLQAVMSGLPPLVPKPRRAAHEQSTAHIGPGHETGPSADRDRGLFEGWEWHPGSVPGRSRRPAPDRDSTDSDAGERQFLLASHDSVVPGPLLPDPSSSEALPGSDTHETRMQSPGERPTGLRQLGAFTRRHASAVVVLVAVATVFAITQVLASRAQPLPSVVASTLSSLPSTVRAGSDEAGPHSDSSPSISSTPSVLVRVHVLGAVQTPGVVSLPAGARVLEAIRAAGGLAPGADPAQLNLAALVPDGAQIIVGTASQPFGELRTAPAAPSAAAITGDSGQPAAQLNLNTATAEQLDGLPGVGPVTAQHILDWRTAHGPFTRVEELQEVDGIGPKTYAEIAPHVRV